MADMHENDEIRQGVRKRYRQIATADGGGCCSSKSCCTPDALGQPGASAKLGYSDDDLAAVPEGANMGLGCGNPQAIADLKPGETVLDLGSGGGFDCFLAARQVGDAGRVIGVDMTPEMISKARVDADKGGYGNVEFRLGEIEHLPVADGSVDVILSNCVINLSPDKPQVYRDAFRVLRPGGRLAISDVVLVDTLPLEVRSSLDAHCGCIAGAATVADLERVLADAGFADVQIRVKEESRKFIKDWFPGSGVEERVRSAEVEARKAAPPACCSSAPTTGEGPQMNAQTKELIAIGASVAGHCQPCLTYHITEAKELGVADDRIQAAIEVGHMVEKGATAAMREFARRTVGISKAQTVGCCPDTTAKSGKSCCG